MGLTWKDGLATVFVGAAVVLYLLSQGDATVAGLSGPRALTIAILALSGGSTVALATLTAGMVVLWTLATIRHAMSHGLPEVIHPAH